MSAEYYQPNYSEGPRVPHRVDRGPHAQEVLSEAVRQPERAYLGPVETRTDIQSSIGPFLVLPEYHTRYPGSVTRALGSLYAEYNQAFRPLVSANREWDTDYQYAIDPDGTPLNRWVQIDMVALPQAFLHAAGSLPDQEVAEALRHHIFEIENSLAMYQLLQRIFDRPDHPSRFDAEFRLSLNRLRAKFGKPIALLAVTDQKYEAMRQSEFGKAPGEALSNQEVLALSGFDAFFGPDDFAKHLQQTGGSDYLLYVRSSDPLSKLKDPQAKVSVPLLENAETRKVIKAHSLTFNIDAPGSDPSTRINDTKGYLGPMGMAYPATSDTDLLSRQFLEHLASGKPFDGYPHPDRFTPEFAAYLASKGYAAEAIQRAQVALRAKPEQGTYGCYGHVVGSMSDKRTRQELRSNLKRRGRYVIQPELNTPTITNTHDGTEYTCIDRVFFTTDGHTTSLMGGFRSCMPVDSVEAASGRNHGSKQTVWAEIS